MTRLGLIAGLSLLLFACNNRVAPIVDYSPESYRQEVLSTYQVASGDTLYGIAFAAGLDYQQLASWNGIVSPFIVRPGDRLTLTPRGNGTVEVRPRVVELPPSEPQAPREIASLPPTTPPVAETAVASGPTRESVAVAAAVNEARYQDDGRWRWPTQGQLQKTYSAEIKGIEIGGVRGAPVVASRGGVVVYAGTGIRGYGRLVIVKHSSDYLSAYALLDRIDVKEGDQVNGGEAIGTVGGAGGGDARLHFEVRQGGKPINPQPLLS
ncbi:peptidoglycan DD-metalloendopeptidase family protein [Gammaproteobacteria bacterium]|nr:peptidoglycan DD-metalloendopeptidase family protein [Gammaproteobacteria bacterium]